MWDYITGGNTFAGVGLMRHTSADKIRPHHIRSNGVASAPHILTDSCAAIVEAVLSVHTTHSLSHTHTPGSNTSFFRDVFASGIQQCVKPHTDFSPTGLKVSNLNVHHSNTTSCSLLVFFTRTSTSKLLI